MFYKIFGVVLLTALAMKGCIQLSVKTLEKCDRYSFPHKKDVVEKYTDDIIKGFAESEFDDIKIRLLKILKDEPYTPVCFLDEMLVCKYLFDQQQKNKECVKTVRDFLNLTVLIEKIEQNVNDKVAKRNFVRKHRFKNISKM